VNRWRRRSRASPLHFFVRVVAHTHSFFSLISSIGWFGVVQGIDPMIEVGMMCCVNQCDSHTWKFKAVPLACRTKNARELASRCMNSRCHAPNCRIMQSWSSKLTQHKLGLPRFLDGQRVLRIGYTKLSFENSTHQQCLLLARLLKMGSSSHP
jgi:hypothetical protein